MVVIAKVNSQNIQARILLFWIHVVPPLKVQVMTMELTTELRQVAMT